MKKKKKEKIKWDDNLEVPVGSYGGLVLTAPKWLAKHIKRKR